MTKVIAAFNMTLDGVCDHTAGIADEALHRHYTDLLQESDAVLYGRTTYELMQFWQTVLKSPTGQKELDEFATALDQVQKLVFSTTLKETGWHSATLATKPPKEEISELKKRTGKDILVGSRSLIIQLLNCGLIDEFQICIHPVIEGKGLALFDGIQHKISLRYLKTKTLGSGAAIMYYEPQRR